MSYPTDPNCARCGHPHEMSMAQLTEPDPSLPVYCLPCETTVCVRCGQFGADSRVDFSAVCNACRESEREPQGEAVRLFTPAPAVMPGQLGFGVSRENPGT